MMSLSSNLLAESGILLDAGLTDKTEVLQALSGLLADSEISQEEILLKFEEREDLGSTGLGYGVALPHARSNKIVSAKAAFVRLQTPTEFEAPDDEDVDLVFALLVPEGANEEYLQLLATLAKLMNNPDVRNTLRNAQTPQEVIQTMTTDTPLSQSA
jgi:PTS system nitrogen regulatory IIA component